MSATKEETMDRVRSPRPGDTFTEMYSHYLQVIEVGRHTGVLCARWSPPCTVPDDNQYVLFPSREAFECFMGYDSPSMMGKSWMHFIGNREEELPPPEMIEAAHSAGKVEMKTTIWGKPWPRPQSA